MTGLHFKLSSAQARMQHIIVWFRIANDRRMRLNVIDSLS